jgi:hypothetical protein
MPIMKIEDDDSVKCELIQENNQLPVGHLSVSQVNMYQRCAKQYEFRYVQKLISPPAVPLLEGSAVHAVLEEHNRQLLNGTDGMKIDVADEYFSCLFTDAAKEAGKEIWYSVEDTEKTVLERFNPMFSHYLAFKNHGLIPVTTPEKKFETVIHGFPVIGYIDNETKDSVVDYKAVKATKSQGETDNDLQLSVYSGITGKQDVAFCCFVKSKHPSTVVVKSNRGPSAVNWAHSIIKEVGSAIIKGVFPPCQPSSWCCSERFCGYYHLCRGKKQSSRKRVA